jgi:hypothetical protein
VTRTTLAAGAALAAALMSLAAVGAAQARTHGHTVTAQGAGGRGFTQSRQVNRTGAGASVSRGVQTNGGYGASTTRTSSYGGGQYSGAGQTTFDNGSTISRSSSVQANGDGSADYEASRTGVNGQTRSVSGTIQHTTTP